MTKPKRPQLPAQPPFISGPFEIRAVSGAVVGQSPFGGTEHLLDLRGWGFLIGQGQGLALTEGEAIAAHAATLQWVAAALNEKWAQRQTILAADRVYVTTSKNGDYVSAVPEEGSVMFVRARLTSPDTRAVTGAQLERWLEYISDFATEPRAEILAIIGGQSNE